MPTNRHDTEVLEGRVQNSQWFYMNKVCIYVNSVSEIPQERYAQLINIITRLQIEGRGHLEKREAPR